ncbi:MAG: carotenoid biosynthesis protein [Patescibacteria group bacterium]
MQNNRYQRLLRVTLTAFLVFILWGTISILFKGFDVTSFWGFGLSSLLSVLLIWVIGGKMYGLPKSTITILSVFLVISGAFILNGYKGWPFGFAFHQDILGYKFLKVAWPIPVFWTFFVSSAIMLVHPKKVSNDPKTLFSWSFDAAIVTMILALIIEPLAAKTIAISWAQTGPVLGVPVSGILGWFVTGFISAFTAILASRIWQNYKNSSIKFTALALGLYQILFFALAFKNGTALLMILSSALAIIFLFLAYKNRSKNEPDMQVIASVTETTVEVIEKID